MLETEISICVSMYLCMYGSMSVVSISMGCSYIYIYIYTVCSVYIIMNVMCVCGGDVIYDVIIDVCGRGGDSIT